MPTLESVTVPVIKAFQHDGRDLAPGDTVTVRPVDALVLARQKLVSLSEHYKTREVTPAKDPEPEPEPETPRRRRTYRRRDMQAEGS